MCSVLSKFRQFMDLVGNNDLNLTLKPQYSSTFRTSQVEVAGVYLVELQSYQAIHKVPRVISVGLGSALPIG